MKKEILKIGVPNLNGRIYTQEVAELIVANAKYPMFGMIGMRDPDTPIEIDKISHEVSNIRIEGDSVVCDVRILTTPMGKILEAVVDEVEFRTCGKGFPVDAGLVSDGSIGQYITDYELITVNAIEKSRAA